MMRPMLHRDLVRASVRCVVQGAIGLATCAALLGPIQPISAQDAYRSEASTELAQGVGFKIPDRVSVNYEGTWYPGSIYAERDGRYKVLRDGYTSDERWVASSELRRAPVVTRDAGPRAALPKNIPLGAYTCGTVLSGFSTGSSTGMTIGQITVVGDGVYTSLTKEGTGARAAFTYSPQSGKIEWEGGKLQGFFGKVVGSRFALDNRGKPIIQVTYRVREGGNLFDLSCQ